MKIIVDDSNGIKGYINTSQVEFRRKENVTHFVLYSFRKHPYFRCSRDGSTQNCKSRVRSAIKLLQSRQFLPVLLYYGVNIT